MTASSLQPPSPSAGVSETANSWHFERVPGLEVVAVSLVN
jgi:hypothetical protein